MKRNKIIGLFLSLVLIASTCISLVSAKETPYNDIKKEWTLEELQKEWTDEKGYYPGQCYEGKYGVRYRSATVDPLGSVEISSVIESQLTGKFITGYVRVFQSNGTTFNDYPKEAQAVVKLISLDEEKQEKFWQWITFATIDEALKWAENGDTIQLNGNYNAGGLNISEDKINCFDVQYGPATFTYNVSSNFTIPKGKDIIIDLNGHTIAGSSSIGRIGTFPQMKKEDVDAHKRPEPPVVTGEVTERVGITVAEGATLNIVDSVGGGKVVGALRAENSTGEETQNYHSIVNNGTLSIADNVVLENPASETGNEGTALDIDVKDNSVTQVSSKMAEALDTNAKTIKGTDSLLLVSENTYTSYVNAEKELEDLVNQLMKENNFTDEGREQLEALLKDKKMT